MLQTPEAEDLRSLFLSSPSLHALLTIAFGVDGNMFPGREAGKEDWPLLMPPKEGWTVEKLKEERAKFDTGVLTHHGLLLLTTLLRMENESGGEGGLLATRNTPIMQALCYLWSLHRPSSSTSSPSYYGAPSIHPPSVLDIPHTRAQADQVLILECLLIYSKGHPMDSEGLLSLLEVFTRPTFTGTERREEEGKGGPDDLLIHTFTQIISLLLLLLNPLPPSRPDLRPRFFPQGSRPGRLRRDQALPFLLLRPGPPPLPRLLLGAQDPSLASSHPPLAGRDVRESVGEQQLGRGRQGDRGSD